MTGTTVRTTVRVVIVAGLVLLAALMVHDRAAAQVRYINDGRNWGMAFGDISRVQLDYAPRNVFTKVSFHRGYGWRMRVYYDVRGWDPGPEFVLDTYLENGEGMGDWSLYRIDSFRDAWPRPSAGQKVSCNDRVSITRTDALFTAVQRYCLRINGVWPRRVRTSVWSWDRSWSGPYYEAYDWAPGRKKFGPWVWRA